MGCGDPGLLVGGDTPSALKAGGGEADWAMSRGGTPGEGGDMARRFEDDNSFTGLSIMALVGVFSIGLVALAAFKNNSKNSIFLAGSLPLKGLVGVGIPFRSSMGLVQGTHRVLGRDMGRLFGRDIGRLLGRDIGRLLGRDIGRLLGRDIGTDMLLGRDMVKLFGREIDKLSGLETNEVLERGTNSVFGLETALGRANDKFCGWGMFNKSPRDAIF